ncbi:MAG: hypothetical protein IT436_00960 [Phycisphaerales bacterium]|nr:hypothetical protein [Phycisphaerales bacterium]
MAPGDSQPPIDTGPAPTSGPVFVSSAPDGGGRWRRRFAAISVGLVALLSALLIVAVWQSRMEPGWWTGTSAAAAGSGAGAGLQNSVINQLHLARPTAADLGPDEAWRSEPWRVSMRCEDVNAWLAEELPRWLANRDPPVRWPARVETARAGFEAGRVMVGARLRHGGGFGGVSVISASLVPELREDGSLWLRASWVRIGRLPAPASWVVPRLREAMREAGLEDEAHGGVGFLLRVLEGEEPLARSAVIRLEDGRRVRLLDLELRDGALWITARTEQGR